MKLSLPRLPLPPLPLLPNALASLHCCAALLLAERVAGLKPPPSLEGKRFSLVLSDLGITIGFRCLHGHFLPWQTRAPDLMLRADRRDYWQLLRGQTDADTLFFQRRLQISGDTELGLRVKNWLDGFERPAWLAVKG